MTSRAGQRVPQDTHLERFNLCLSHPDVRRLSAERLLEWMDRQPGRRFFWMADQDGGPCECEACRAHERWPGFATDRVLEWVNEAARAAAAEHPDNRIFTLAYIQSVAPPFEVKPEPNVVLFYCPWWRDGRNCVVHDWLCPHNTGAMKQFMGWSIRFPNQLGVYDYGVVSATDRVKADLIKFLAKHRVRGFYFDGRPEAFLPLHTYITRSLFWNPYLDTAKLRTEFLRDCYGPGAPFLERYFERVDARLENRDVHTITRLGPLNESAFLAEALDLFGVSRYLEQLGFGFPVPGQREMVPELKDRFVNPMYLLDWPSFRQRPLPAAGWQLRASATLAAALNASTARIPAGDARGHLERTAGLIKACARQGRTEPPPILLPAEQTELFTYVIARLLWNPFLDTSRLVGEFSRQPPCSSRSNNAPAPPR